VNGEEHDNPFYVPPDEEIFRMKDKIKQKKRRQREEENNQKIWEKKKKHNNEGKLREMNNI